MNSNEPNQSSQTYSVMLHVRRTTYEDAYIAVPVTKAVIKAQEDGKSSLDFEALVREALHLSQNGQVEWEVEEVASEAHPIQGPVPGDRRAFDPLNSS